MKCRKPYSKRMMILLRHTVFVNLMAQFPGKSWIKMLKESKREISGWTGRHVFEYCVDNNHHIQYMRSVQGHSARLRIDSTLQNIVSIPHGWTDYIYHVGSTFDYKSLSERGIIVSGIGVRQGRQSCCFTAVNPMNV